MPKILIVEDEKILGEMYRDKFKEERFETDLVSSSEEALDWLKKRPKEKMPDLVLLDILLPKDNGISLLRKMREDEDLMEISVVAFSNYDDPAAKKEAFSLGVKDYLLKTQYTPDELVSEVRKYLKGK
jgi:two-component system alkaline phosphatase synthesis response regulator PhoP